jgi:hypothetical protein
VGVADLRQNLGLGPAPKSALIVTDDNRFVPDMRRAMPPTTAVTVIPYKGSTSESIQQAARNCGADLALVVRSPSRIEMPSMGTLDKRDFSGDGPDAHLLRVPVLGPILEPIKRRDSLDPAFPPPWPKPIPVPAIAGLGMTPDLGRPSLPPTQGLGIISIPPIKPDAVDKKTPSIPNVHWAATPGDLKWTDTAGINPSPNAGAGVGGWKSGTVAPAAPPIRTYTPPVSTYTPPIRTYTPPPRVDLPKFSPPPRFGMPKFSPPPVTRFK